LQAQGTGRSSNEAKETATRYKTEIKQKSTANTKEMKKWDRQ
jgi:hypothetical protein